MTEATSLIELAERVEAATGPDRELDCLIGVAIGRFFTAPNKGWPERLDYCERHGDSIAYPGNGFDQLVPRYTASIDAATSLVPVWFNYGAGRDTICPGTAPGWAWVTDQDNFEVVKAATPALALCAAAIRARASL